MGYLIYKFTKEIYNVCAKLFATLEKHHPKTLKARIIGVSLNAQIFTYFYFYTFLKPIKLYERV